MRSIPVIVYTAVIWFMATCTAVSLADDRTSADSTGDHDRSSVAQPPPGQATAEPPDASPPEGRIPSSSDASAPGAKSDPTPQPPGEPPAPDTPQGSEALPSDTTPRKTDDAVVNTTTDETKEDTQEGVSPSLLQESAEAVPDKESVWTLTPEYVRSLTPIIPGHNDSNPVWSPSGNMLAFERSIDDQRKIMIALRDGTIIRTIYFQTPEEEGALDLFLPGITDTASYNAGMSWSGDNSSLVFMSNGGSGNYDLYLLPDLTQDQPLRLTRHHGKESHPHWSPMGNRLVFVSGSTGKADIFTMDIASRQNRRITRGKKMYLYPQWSPDGQKIAMIYGSNENHDVFVIENLATPLKSTKALTTWAYDDLRPVWSPDGSKIAFYSNYNLQGDQKLWCIIVVAADGSDIISEDALSANVVAHQVIPDIEQGPAWMPDSRHIVFVKNDEQKFNPIYLVDIEEKSPIAVQTHTKMNHDVSCAGDGTLAFRAQVEQWDHIYIAKIDPEMAAIEEMK